MPNPKRDEGAGDAQLLTAAAAGDRDAFALFVRRHTSALMRYCQLRLTDHASAEDAAQEAMLRVFDQVQSGVVPEHPLIWLLAVARNCCSEQRRRGQRERLLPLENAAQAQTTATTDRDNDRLSALLETLTDEQRSLILMKHTEGLSCREIADRTGQPLGTVTSALSRAYARLRANVQKREPQENE